MNEICNPLLHFIFIMWYLLRSILSAWLVTVWITLLQDLYNTNKLGWCRGNLLINMNSLKIKTININYFFQRNCVNMGGHLASVHSINEYTFIQDLVLNATGSYPLTWLGATDVKQVCDTKTSVQCIWEYIALLYT